MWKPEITQSLLICSKSLCPALRMYFQQPLFQITIAWITKCNNTFLGCSMRNILIHFAQQATNDCRQTQILTSLITTQSVYCYEWLMLILLSINNSK